MKLKNLAVAGALLFFASCSHNDIDEQPAQKFTPVIHGTMGQLTDATPKTKSGVIENNPDYALGEQFYWVDGDSVKMLFFANGDLESTPIELLYTAVVSEGEKTNNCDFTTEGSIAAGSYTVYGLYPANSWYKDGIGYKAAIGSTTFTQTNTSSTHLGSAMFMKAKATGVIVGEGGTGLINLSFKHLAAVVRFHITDATRPTPLSLRYMSIKLGDYTLPSAVFDLDFFPRSAYLQGGIDDNSLIPQVGTKINRSWVSVYQNFTDNGTIREFDVFMPVFPTGAPVNLANHRIYFEAMIKFDPSPIMQDFGTKQNGLSFQNQLSFMPNGFEAGKSYYFNLKTSP